ncbi:tryptophan 2,3-dioxygenase [Embleya hyalina]|uniref:Tryptophan 2,3-dioxygenase n=1 Tax=Embleya hyalina TaxID=516124 RepID=A0A401Z625_9ACTN|nr:tryptophan 2,3-dioxygenase family protein [Embleya hyalina]GCE02295.1 tryptophan 2,3-dioxygenase [Embleya hyalina]
MRDRSAADTVPTPARCPFGAGADRDGPAPYVSYARMDELHELARPLTDSPCELTFILISHVKEILFRTIHIELDQARTAIRQDEISVACEHLQRATRSQQALLTSWEVLSAMAPDEFLEFRDILGEASGTQSFMYRALEFTMGNKDPDTVRAWKAELERYPMLRAELQAPSVYDEAIRYLARQGAELPPELLERDVTRRHEPHPLVEQAWLEIYLDPAGRPVEHRLAEALSDVSFRFSVWRSTHLLVVERMLGGKPGTGGTTGLDWLRTINEHRFFPELWSVRTLL